MNRADFFASIRPRLDKRSVRPSRSGRGVGVTSVAFFGSIIGEPPRRNGNGSFKAMASPHPHIYSAFGNSEMATRCANAGELQSIDRHGAQVSLMLRALFGAGRPSAIVRFIPGIWINAINSVIARRPLAHVGEKIFKRRFPSRADSDATSAVSGKVLGPHVGAPPLHANPDPVGRTWALRGLMPVLRVSISVRHVN